MAVKKNAPVEIVETETVAEAPVAEEAAVEPAAVEAPEAPVAEKAAIEAAPVAPGAPAEKEDRELVPASANAVDEAWRMYQKAVNAFAIYGEELSGQGIEQGQLTKLIFKFVNKEVAPVKADVDRLVKHAKAAVNAAQALASEAAQAEAKANAEKQEKSLGTLAGLINRTVDWLKNHDRMEGGDELREELVTLSFDLVDGTTKPTEGWKAFKAIEAKILAYKITQVTFEVNKANNYWLLDRDGLKANRHATAYYMLGWAEKVTQWLAKEPSSTADYKQHAAWIGQGWDLKNAIKYSFGRCTGEHCEGRGVLTPGKDGKPMPKCGKCFHASKPSGQGGTVREPQFDAQEELAAGGLDDESGINFIPAEKTQKRVRPSKPAPEDREPRGGRKGRNKDQSAAALAELASLED